MATPKPVTREAIRSPLARNQNVPLTITPAAVDSFEHHAGYSFLRGVDRRDLSLWAFPWWLADAASAPTSGGFSTAFSSAFDGGVDSPTGTAWGRGFSSAFG